MWSIYFAVTYVLCTAISDIYSNPTQCPLGENYSTCANANCRCASGDIGILCPQLDRNSCQPGCVCGEGFLRNTENICVEERLCDLRFTLSAESKCSENQKYSSCVNGICRIQECNESNRTVCPQMVAGSCRPGCICKQGYLKNSTGHCVKEDQCDDSRQNNGTGTIADTSQCPQGEVYSACANANCKCVDGYYLCPQVLRCDPGCVCVSGFIRRFNICITEDQCRSQRIDI